MNAAMQTPSPGSLLSERARIKVIGVGGGGSNTVMRILGAKVPGVEFYCANTDTRALSSTHDATMIRLGENLTHGLGAGGNVEIGLKAARESEAAIQGALSGADLVFITAGMGGGTGSGAAPVVAEIASSLGALTVAIVTTPFSFEGPKRAGIANASMMSLESKVDMLIAVSNERLLNLAGKKTSVQEAFKKGDEVSGQAIIAVSRIINVPGQINVDFADLKAILKKAGTGIIATGRGAGEDRAVKATKAAIENPLADISIEGAKGVLFIFTGGPSLGLAEMNEAGRLIADTVDPEAQVFFGMAVDPKMGEDVEVVLVATHLRHPVGAISSQPATSQTFELPGLTKSDSKTAARVRSPGH